MEVIEKFGARNLFTCGIIWISGFNKENDGNNLKSKGNWALESYAYVVTGYMITCVILGKLGDYSIMSD